MRGGRITLQHNTLINQTALAYSTAAVYIATDCGHQNNVLVTGNLLAGGALALYGGDSTATNIRVLNNLFSTQIFPNSGVLRTGRVLVARQQRECVERQRLGRRARPRGSPSARRETEALATVSSWPLEVFATVGGRACRALEVWPPLGR